MIIDAFTFFNELELLEIRLNELKGTVDLFVLVEATGSFTSEPKPLVYEKNKERFSGFNISHVVVDDMPNTGNPWDNEEHQRRAILRGLPKKFDWIMISDVDEIPRKDVFDRPDFIEEWHPVHQPMFMYYLNTQLTRRWNGTVIASRDFFDFMLRRNCHEARLGRRHGKPLLDGGWHFSWLADDPKRVLKKIVSISETRLARTKSCNVEKITELIANLKEFEGKRTLKPVPIVSGEFPEYLVQNQEKFKHLIYERKV